ncbi:hypothetical protein I315_03539 [Cryptococcus gattii Ru294]|uniref:Uncharacterized protein n=2 Tax=Cryptococcus gattii TaxID=37769 RepID=E6R5I6_CRYGW|nr:Hypothetical protein CGB_D1430C [Cryptococcus gattii WM276]KIR53922.1 hypothetical protein I315_03539 [Cryptococcus gattii Ru294]KIR81018.1 hypothetical protein I306_01887 [Cryptococcus gattii EJB2]KIY34080.1 hypothetical protein I305_03432 [Cryptococcus gattii E566]KJE03791.1 hypothetical protein I311_02557 [Cryptococcus gattii NT-10]ADV21585.1 Hypothetical protein CGB_D1430C [Cryptococcus gattii WM276]
MRLLHSVARLYNTNFDRRPVATLVVTNGVLNTIADVLMHNPTPQSPTPTYDPYRTLRFAVFGMGMGPIIGRWMRFLERAIPIPAKASLGTAGKGAGGILTGPAGASAGVGKASGEGIQLVKRVVADQTVMAPIGLVIFVGSMGVMEGHTVEEIKEKFQDIYLSAILANWKIWPIIQGINFKLMPIQYRVPFQSTCGIAWTLYLSLLNAK